MTRPSVISVAAGASQLPLIQQAKAKGLSVIGIDANPEAPGLRFCDYHIECSTHDADLAVELVKNLPKKFEVVAVVTKSSGLPLVVATRLAQFLGLPSPPLELAEIVVSKDRFIQKCLERDLPTATPIALADAKNQSLFPLIVKPKVTKTGKVGISRVDDPEHLPDALTKARSASIDGEAHLESFVDGSDVIASFWVVKGRIHPVALIKEWTAFSPGGEVVGLGTSIDAPKMPESLQQVAWGLANRFSRAFQITTSFVSLSMRVTSDGSSASLIEAHLDLGGDFILDLLIPSATGSDPVSDAVDVYRGIDPSATTGSIKPAMVYHILNRDLNHIDVSEIHNLCPWAEVVFEESRPQGGDYRRAGAILLIGSEINRKADQINEMFDRPSGMRVYYD